MNARDWGIVQENFPLGKKGRAIAQARRERETRAHVRGVRAHLARSPKTRRKGEAKGNQSGKRVRGASDDSSLQIKAPVNAVVKTTVSVSLEYGTPIIRLELEEVSRDLIKDTSSNISILQPGVSGRDISVNSVKPFRVTAEVLDLKGQLTVSFVLGGHDFEHTFYVCTLPTDAAGLIGTDFLERTGAIISFECAKISF
jgi:hypothetical protein